jgi:hypothetical protein
MMAAQATTNLTGIWQGLYTYPRLLQRVLFGATLIESGSWVTGSTQEIASVGPHKGETVTALLDGQRNESSITFTKKYDERLKNYRHAVIYEGAVSSDATEIEGRWSIAGSWSGKFLMIRSAGKEQAVDRKVFEHI